MILGPSPSLPALEAADVALRLRRILRDAAGPERAHEVRTRGGGRVSVPVDLIVEAPSDLLESLPDGSVVLLAATRDEERRMIDRVILDDTDTDELEAEAGGPDPADRSLFPTIDTLVDYAREHDIDLDGATRRADIEAAITAHTTPVPADTVDPV